MKKIVLLLSFIVSLSCAAVAQEALPAKLVNSSLLLDIAETSTGFIAVGERGHVVLGSANGDWHSTQQTFPPTRVTLTAVSVVGDKVWAVGHDLTIIHSADAGQTWSLQYQDTSLDKPFLDVTFFDANHGVAIGAYGAFYRTVDGGASWQQELHPSLLDPLDVEYLEEIRELDGEEFYREELTNILPHLNRVELSQGQLYLVGETGLVAVSRDFGRSWERLDLPYEGSLFAVSVDASGVFVAGLRGNAFIQRDAQWYAVDLCHAGSVNSMINYEDKVLTLANNGFYSQVSLGEVSADIACQLPFVNTTQTSDKLAIVSGIVLPNQQLITVGANGLQSLNLQ
jgi:photosystem II stability/assembly factor-like uncharacterized protein